MDRVTDVIESVSLAAGSSGRTREILQPRLLERDLKIKVRGRRCVCT